MQYVNHSWALLAFFCSTIAGTEIILPVKHDRNFFSKGIIGGEWTDTANDDLEITGGSKDDLYNTHNGVSKVNEKHERYKRTPVFSDSGYGSRLTAGSNIAHDYLALKKVFGNAGPGKRSGVHTNWFDRPKVKPKRDYGYGSRLRAGEQMGNSVLARNSLYGIHGPGRKRYGHAAPLYQSSEPVFDTNIGRMAAIEWLAENNNPLYDRLATNEETDGSENVEKRRLVSDSGYSSRIDAANNVATDLNAIHDVFGIYGPGKR